MDALERIEVAVRAAISDTMSVAAGPHWFVDAQHFARSFDHQGLLNRIASDVGAPNGSKAQSHFIGHYYQTYGSPRLPPSWMVFEVVSFGTISRIFEFIEKPHRKAIAEAFGFPPQRLVSWFHGLTHLRNLCAHHERIWNRVFRVSPSVPKEEKDYVPEPKKFYVQALVIQSLLFRISEETHWGARLADLMAEHPGISPGEMGFPLQWQARPLWAASF
jgi:abortive infection bacteriophage resistance protein